MLKHDPSTNTANSSPIVARIHLHCLEICALLAPKIVQVNAEAQTCLGGSMDLLNSTQNPQTLSRNFQES